MYRQSLYDRFFQYKTQDIAELAGECENRIREYRPSVTKDEIRDFTVEVMKKKSITFGEIRCLAKGIHASKENQMTLLQNHTPRPLTEKTKSNSLVIAFEDVDQVHEGFKQHGREILGDIINFTNVKPKFQISEVESLWLTDGYVHTHDH